MNKEIVTRTTNDLIKKNRLEYHSFGPEYIKQGFCETTGGFWVSHIDHLFDPVKGGYERDASYILYTNGYKVILESELNKKRGQKYSDGLLNDGIFEIQSVDGTGKNNIKGHFNNCFRKKVSLVVLYYPKPEYFSFRKLKEGYKKYMGLPRSTAIKTLYIHNGKVYKYN